MFEFVELSRIRNKNRGILRKPSGTRPVLWRIEENGIRAVVKDFSHNRFLFRNIIGRFLVWRESRAYRQLTGIEGIPLLYRNVKGIALIIQEIPGKDLESLGKGTTLPESFFRELTVLVDRMHKRGIVHCDLKRAPNIILGEDGRPYIVDWSASISAREFPFYPLSLIYRRFIRDDRNAITKIRLKYLPESVGPEEKRRYLHRNRSEKAIRALRDKARELLQKIA